jgi:hypoxanthine phosphoribosyltransferase
MKATSYEKYIHEILIDEETLQKRITELGKIITDDYKDCPNLTLICILKGGVVFLTDLARKIDVPHKIDFMAASSYGYGARESQGVVRIDMDVKSPIKGEHILIIEDIIDSGHTLAFVIDTLKARHPASLKLCTLLDKKSRREVDILVDYVGFEIENKYVFGYGLDLDEKYRNVPFIAVANEDAVKEGI